MRRHLSAVCGISYQAVAQWFNDDGTEITAPNLQKIAKDLGVTMEYILTGRPDLGPVPAGELPDNGTDVPIVDFATLPDWVSNQDSGPRATTALSWTICPVKHGRRTFAFRVNDDSMATTTANSIPAGYFVWVDPDQRQAQHNRPVLARLENGEYLLAQYMEQAGRRWLHLLNPVYPAISGQFEIIGRVIFKGEET